jgi:hypothetical protein
MEKLGGYTLKTSNRSYKPRNKNQGRIHREQGGLISLKIRGDTQTHREAQTNKYIQTHRWIHEPMQTDTQRER